MRVGALIDDLSAAGLVAEMGGSDDAADTAALNVEVNDVEHDSRAVRDGALFCAVRGATVDGHGYAQAAVDRGAAALLVEEWIDVAVPQIRVLDSRRAMAVAAATVHQHPSTELAVFGITGTNGKTTTTQMLAAVLSNAGQRVDVIGTLTGAHTTPESTLWQRQLRAAVDSGVDSVVAEVSSHALDQHRVDATTFAVAAFSNLTPDHLDYHKTMQAYFEAKQLLFDGRAVNELINVDDAYGARLAATRPTASQLTLRDVSITASELSHTTFTWRGESINLRLAGEMNVANALMAAEAALLLGCTAAQVRAGLESIESVPGRMQVVDGTADADLSVVVDYSHTPDSIERALATIRATAEAAQVWIVFGCGGDRDRSKRPLMGAAAEAGADRVIVTSDNPRSEDPATIIDECLAGMTEPEHAMVDVDRRSAIETAVRSAEPGAVILIAGKGHERTQTIGDTKHPFDDVVVAQEMIEAHR